jgi:hypothetical protein
MDILASVKVNYSFLSSNICGFMSYKVLIPITVGNDQSYVSYLINDMMQTKLERCLDFATANHEVVVLLETLDAIIVPIEKFGALRYVG